MRPMTLALWSLLGVLAGACIALQAPLNAQLSRDIGLPIAAAAISFLAGSIVLVAIAAILVRTEHATLHWQAPAPWLFVAGGLLGSVYVTSTILLTPRLGAAAVMALAISGQLLAGLLLDRFGLFGLAVREISLGRALGAALLVAGVLMIRFL